MVLVKKTIKKALVFLGIYKTKNIWPTLSEKKKNFLIDNVTIKSSIETLNAIKATIVNEQKGAYMRFGDGDIFLMLGRDDMLHKANEKMAKEMKEAMKIRKGVIHKGYPFHSQLLGYEQGMEVDMHLVSDVDALKFLAATYSFIDIHNVYTSFALHYLATFNQESCVLFLRFLRSTNPIFVGNKNLDPELLKKLFSETHIKTPVSNSYLEIDRIEKELIQELDKKKDEFQVIVLAMGCPGRILQKRILKKGYNVYLFDFGSLLDALNNDNTRLWIDVAGGTENLKNILNKLDN
jgi:hypothetical protein